MLVSYLPLLKLLSALSWVSPSQKGASTNRGKGKKSRTPRDHGNGAAGRLVCELAAAPSPLRQLS